jgi:FKBP-type peptidyl-prolyl cis-trans isomerase
MTMKVNSKGKDTLLMSTYDELPQFQQVGPSMGGYDPNSAIMDVLSQIKKGDSVYMTFAIDSFIAKDPTLVQKTPFRKGDQLITTIKVIDVFRTADQARADAQKTQIAGAAKMEAKQLKGFKGNPQVQAQMQKDSKIIEDYLAANHIQAQKTDWGAYVQVLNPGSGPMPKPGQFVSVRYKGTDMAGEVFDSNQQPNAPVYPLQVGTGSSIKGFEEGVKNLQKGAKARIFIPSMLGYGPQGQEPKIKPNENLIFDVEVVDISDNPPMQNQPPVNIDTTKKGK